MLERRAISEFRFNDARTVSGVAMRYHAPALIGGVVEEFRPGSFADSLDDVRLDVQHDRRRILTRTGSGLELQDGSEALTFRASLPSTRESDDALELVRRGILRGASIEFIATAEQYEGRKRIVKSADLVAVSLVDDPAYKASTIEARRADKRGLSGTYKLGSTHTVKASGRKRKTRLTEALFDYHVPAFNPGLAKKVVPKAADEFDISINLGSNLNSALATTGSKTLEVFRRGKELIAKVKRLPDTQAARDLIALIDGGIPLYLRPRYRTDGVPNATHIEPEPGNKDVDIEVIDNAILLGFDLGVRGRNNGYQPVKLTQSRSAVSRRRFYYA